MFSATDDLHALQSTSTDLRFGKWGIVRRPGADDPAQRPVRVFVVDDHTVVRRGLRSYLAVVDDMEVVGEAMMGRRRWRGLRPGAAVGARCGADGPADARQDGGTATAAITQRHPRWKWWR